MQLFGNGRNQRRQLSSKCIEVLKIVSWHLCIYIYIYIYYNDIYSIKTYVDNAGIMNIYIIYTLTGQVKI